MDSNFFYALIVHVIFKKLNDIMVFGPVIVVKTVLDGLWNRSNASANEN
jgi:hypothetical protein